MKSLLLVATFLLPQMLLAGSPIEVELIGPTKNPAVITQDALAAAAAIAPLAKEFQSLRESDEEHGEETLERMRELEKLLATGRNQEQGIAFKLRITNTTLKPFTFRYGPDTSTNTLTLEGPGAVNLPYQGLMTLEFRQPEPTTLAPGESAEFTIKDLHYGQRDLSRWLISRPGTYTVTLQFVTTAGETKIDLRTKALSFEVKGSE